MDTQLSTQISELPVVDIPEFEGTQVQVYRRRIMHPKGYYVEYTKIETISTTPIPLPGKVLVSNNTISPSPGLGPSFEVLFVLLILLLLPIFTCVAYRYGKKMGKKENSSANAGIKKKKNSNKIGRIIHTIAQASREENKPLVLYEGVNSPLLLPNNSICETYEKPEENQEICLAGNGLKEASSIKLSSSGGSQTTGKGLSLVGQFSTVNEQENSSGSQGNSQKEDLMKFQVQMTRLYSNEEKNNGEISNGLNEEKLKLHSENDQVQKVEIKYNLSFENKDGSLQKVERQEVKTTYNPNYKEPENNAAMLKKAYDQYQNSSTGAEQNLLLNKSPERKTQCTALMPYDNQNQALVPVVQGEDQVCIVEEKENQIDKYVEKSPIKIVEVPKAPEITAMNFQIDDIPHETGKFAKIFKNAEVVGEGSFGKVYRVIHKLDGKIYAVKKAKFKLDSFEDLQQKSKVFREVFAMTDLHHPNIVRYSTCWVEIEDKKTKKSKPLEKIQPKIVESKVEATEESEYTPAGSEKSHTNTSSLGFEWDLGGDQDSKTQENEKKHLEAVAKRMESSLLMKSMTKTYNDENSADDGSPSRLSHTGHSEYFTDYNLYLYIQMEYCSGQNLRDYLDSPKRDNSPKKSLSMFRRILEGVYAIHKRGILHRDLKPANIFLDENENIKIGDFGLASLDNNEESKEVTETRTINGSSDKSYSKQVGTPMYASPEQASGGRYNHKTDIYSLGFILSEMLAGLCTHHERYQLFNKLRQSHELTSDFKKKFDKESDLILRMTAFNPEERPTAEEVLGEIDKLLEDGSSPEKKVACR